VVADADARGVAGGCVGTAIEREVLSRLELDRTAGEALDADLRPLQVGQHADLLAEFGRGGAHRGGTRAVVVVRTVGEIQAHHVDALGEQAFQRARRIGGRPEGGDDFRAA